MGWGTFLEISARLFCGLSSSPFALVYPMYASARAIESNSHSINQQCLACWVLFGLIQTMEMVLSELLKWIPFWPHIKGMATILLAISSFQGASYVYRYFISPYFLENSKLRYLLFIPRKNDLIACLPDAAHTNNVQFGSEKLEKRIICQESLEPSCDISKVEYAWPTVAVKARVWRCTLCEVSTSSEKCLKKHLEGKKHKIREQELNPSEFVANTSDRSSIMPKKTKPGMTLNGNVNLIASENLQKCSSIDKPMMWISWQKPPFGCTKLNTDGSVAPGKAGLGGLFRDYRGDAICAFVTKAYCDDIFLVELSAVWRGLALASCLEIRVIWVESDLESVVETISGRRSSSAKASSCLIEIWRLLNNFEWYYISHTWRETNKAADYLSKMVLPGSDVVLFPHNFPIGLCNIIKDDAEGRMYPRG